MQRLIQYQSLWLMLLLAGCASNPISVAETPEQKAFAAYASYAIWLEKAADVAENPQTPDSVVWGIQNTANRATPVAESMMSTALELAEIRAQVAAGTTDEARIAIVTNNLNDWIGKLGPLMAELITAIRSAN